MMGPQPPARYPVFGSLVSATTYDEATAYAMAKAANRESAVLTYLPVHGIVLARRRPEYRKIVNSFDLICPDGQPVRYALKLLHGVSLPERVYGPEHMARLCGQAARENVPVYLYGSTPEVVEQLRGALLERFAGLRVAGWESPPFRPLTDQELDQVVARFNESGAGLVFVGLGCPRQDEFVAKVRERVQAVMLCVGAAFDFHSGNKRMAPAWMQKYSLEWLFRLSQEPGRLFTRYLATNSAFVALLAWGMLKRAVGRGER